MLKYCLTCALACFLLQAESKEIMKKMSRIPPSITNSLVNMGKIDIAFFLSPGNRDSFTNKPLNQNMKLLFPKSQQILEENCPCSSIHNFEKKISDPSDLISKIIMTNEMFTFTEPTASKECCQSRELAEESAIYFDIEKPSSFNKKSLPLILPELPLVKPKQIDIFFFPNKKDNNKEAETKVGKSEKEILISPITNKDSKILKNVEDKGKSIVKKEYLQIVGDKEVRNDFKNLKFKPFHSPFASKGKNNVDTGNKADENKTTTIIDSDKVTPTADIPNTL